jgi:hypothetical protein
MKMFDIDTPATMRKLTRKERLNRQGKVTWAQHVLILRKMMELHDKRNV